MSTIGQESKCSLLFFFRPVKGERGTPVGSELGWTKGRPASEQNWGSGSAPLALTLVKQAGHELEGARRDDWSSVSSKRGRRPGSETGEAGCESQ